MDGPARLRLGRCCGDTADASGSEPLDSQAYQEAQDNYQVIVGTPDQVIERLRYVRDVLGIGHVCLWAHDGYMSHEDTVRCIELLGAKCCRRYARINALSKSQRLAPLARELRSNLVP